MSEAGEDARQPVSQALQHLADRLDREQSLEPADLQNVRLQFAALQRVAGSQAGAIVEQVRVRLAAAEASLLGDPPEQPPNALAEDEESVRDFIVETSDHLDAADQELLELELAPDNPQLVNGLLRRFHTIKGLAGFLDFAAIRELAHAMESLLNRFRDGQSRMSAEAADLLLACVDALHGAMAQLGEDLDAGRALNPSTPAELRDRVLRAAADEVLEAAAPADSDQAATETVAASETACAVRPGPSVPTTLRVEAGKLELLIESAGQLVVAQALAQHHAGWLDEADYPELTARMTEVYKLTQRIQSHAMSMRMAPIGKLFDRTARTVRDLARKLHKQVQVETVGGRSEIDRTLIESLADPFVHIVRNCVDHGIEPAEERDRAGKPAIATLTLRAAQRAGRVQIEIEDDGRGIDLEKIRAAALQRGLLHDGDNPSEPELLDLLFEPGLSTAEHITDISGRGVGLDVVRTRIESCRGTVRATTRSGNGTCLTLSLPLTLALLDGLIVNVAGRRYVAPLFSIRESIRPTAGMLRRTAVGAWIAEVRGEFMPVVRLGRRFAIPGASEDPRQGLLIVSEGSGRRFCLAVDEILGKQELAVKALGGPLPRIPGISSVALLGDGGVGLILDIEALYEESPILEMSSDSR